MGLFKMHSLKELPLVYHEPTGHTGQADLTCQHQGSHTFRSALHGRFHEGCEAEYVPPL